MVEAAVFLSRREEVSTQHDAAHLSNRSFRSFQSPQYKLSRPLFPVLNHSTIKHHLHKCPTISLHTQELLDLPYLAIDHLNIVHDDPIPDITPTTAQYPIIVPTSAQYSITVPTRKLIPDSHYDRTYVDNATNVPPVRLTLCILRS